MYRLSAFYFARTASDLPMVRTFRTRNLMLLHQNLPSSASKPPSAAASSDVISSVSVNVLQDCTIPTIFIIIVYSMSSLK